MRQTSRTRKPQGARPTRPLAIIALTAVTCACAVAVANGQVNVPGVQTPQVDVPPLQNLPQVPSTPSVPQTPSVPEVPGVSVPETPDAPSVPLPSVGGGDGVSTPGVDVPSTGVGGGPAGGGHAGTVGGSGAKGGTAARGPAVRNGAAARSTPASRRAATARAARHRLTPKQRAARHERRLRRSALQLEGCLPALTSFERSVIVLRGGLHGRRPLSRAKTAERLDVGAGRVRSAERSGLAGLEQADAEQGCGLRSGAGRDAAARRLANGSSPALYPLPLTGQSPRLVATSALPKDRGEVLGERASSSDGANAAASRPPRRASILPTSGGDDSGVPAGLLLAILGATALSGAALLLLRHRRAAEASGYAQPSPASPSRSWGVGAWRRPSEKDEPKAEQSLPERPYSLFGIGETGERTGQDGERTGQENGAPPRVERTPPPKVAPAPWERPDDSAEPAADPETETDSEAPEADRRDRAVQTLGGMAATGAALTLLLGRFVGRRRR